MAVIIGDVELLWMGPEPIEHIRIGLQHTGKRQFAVLAVEFRLAENTLLDPCEQNGANISGKRLIQADLPLLWDALPLCEIH